MLTEEEFGCCDGESDLISSPLDAKIRSPSSSSRRRVAEKRRLLDADRAHLLFCDRVNDIIPPRVKEQKKYQEEEMFVDSHEGHFFNKKK